MERADLIPPGALAPGQVVAASHAEVGGKAAGLALLHAIGSPVPPWFVIPAPLVAEWLRDDDVTQAARLSAALEAWSQPPFSGLALRSSAPGEDARESSQAGQYATAFVTAPEELAAAFRRVALSGGASPIPVIAQALIAPTHAGVAFSGNPSGAMPRTLYIEIVAGHGSALVDGSATPARLSYDLVRRELASETGMMESIFLSPKLAAQLAEALLAAEAALGIAVDVEWCAQGETLWLVQARPITALHLDRALLPGETLSAWFFDQRFPDPITPFTQSTLLRLIGDVALGDALRMRGATTEEELPQIYAGRAYTPLRIFETMLRGAPRWWLSADLRQIFGAAGQASGNLLDTLHYAGCAAWTVCTNVGDVFLNTRAWARFEIDAAERLAELPDHAEGWEELERVWAACDALSRRFLQIHRWSILWADYAYRVYQLLLRALPARAREYLESRLRAGIVLPTAEANALMAAWQAAPEDSLKAELLRLYGDRSASLDYAVPTWAELLERAPVAAPMQADGTSMRSLNVAPPSRWSPLAVLARLLELRERQRLEWEHILAKQRRLVLHAAEGLVARGLLNSAAQVWMMTWEEFRAARRDGKAPDADALRLRQHELYLYRAVHPPARVSPVEETREAMSGTTLYGLGASPGVASGLAVLVRDPGTQGPIPPGSILVLRALDPACSGIMCGAAGLVVERGGLLSHAAILAREYRVPLVIGVENVFQSIANGELLQIDGSTGTVGRLA